MEENKLMQKVELLVIGGSAGSFEVLMQIIPKIKPDINFAILIVLHRKSNHSSSIAEIFKLKTSIPVSECEDKDELLPGKIYFAPADYHLLIEKEHVVSLDYSEKVNYSRPSIDITFKSASEVYDKRVAGILLSGANSDGAEGLFYMKKNSGTTIVQDPKCAEVDYMPIQAIRLFVPDYISNLDEMIKLINSFNVSI